jgi:hypothetical protein
VSGSLKGAAKRAIEWLIATELRPGEVAVRHACSDIAGCGCQHHVCLTIPCTVLGRSREADRCLVCGARWQRRDRREQPLVMLEPATTACQPIAGVRRAAESQG